MHNMIQVGDIGTSWSSCLLLSLFLLCCCYYYCCCCFVIAFVVVVLFVYAFCDCFFFQCIKALINCKKKEKKNQDIHGSAVLISK